MLTKGIAVIFNIITFIAWITAYVFLAVGASLLVDDWDILTAITVAACAFGLWFFGFWLFRKSKRYNSQARHIMLFLLAGLTIFLSLILLVIAEIAGFIVILVMSVSNFCWGMILLKREQKQVPSEQTVSFDKSNLTKQTGSDGKETSVISQWNQYVHNLKQLKDDVNNDQIIDVIIHIETISRQVLEFVEAHPKHTAKLVKFMEYYFPTTIKLLENYVSFSQKPVISENVKEMLEKISQGLVGIEKAFEQLLDNLYSDKVMDIDAEVALLQQTMAIEGLGSEKPF